jgi:hypothetical protein
VNLYSYTVASDDGAAPNPYGGVCTLTICKPAIRRKARVGDWIVGLGSKNAPGPRDMGHCVIYAMQVSEVVSLTNYDAHCNSSLRAKLPVWKASEPFEHQVGDCLYWQDADGNWSQRPGVHGRGNQAKDLRGENALLAEENFFYFGDLGVVLADEFLPIRHPTQGHKVHANNEIKEEVVRWLLGGLGAGYRPRILYGKPVHRHLVRPGLPDGGGCGSCRADEDDEDPKYIC